LYWDLLLLLNFVLNYLLLYATCCLGGKHRPPVRMAAGAALGAAPTLAVFWPAAAWVFTLPAKLVLSVAIIFVVFYPFTRRTGIKQWLYFVFVSVAAGGLVIVFSACVWSDVWARQVTFLAPSIPLLLGAALLLTAIVWGLQSYRRAGRWLKEAGATLMFEIFGRKVELPVAVDSGNLLREPVSGLPVVVAPFNLLRGTFPDLLLLAVSKGVADDNMIRAVQSFPQYAKDFRLVPFRCIGGGRGLLPAFKIRSAFLKDADGGLNAVGPVFLALDGQSPASASGEDFALLPGELLEG